LKQSVTPISAFSIEDALAGEQCPYCGYIHEGDRQAHYNNCQERQDNIEIDTATDRNDRWAFHQTYGRVLVISREQGLCVICADFGPPRQVLPINMLEFGAHTRILDSIEEAELSDDQISTIINALRMKLSNFTTLPKYPKLWPGCRIELQLGNTIHRATIKKCNINNYIIVVDGRDTGMNISPKQIVRVV